MIVLEDGRAFARKRSRRIQKAGGDRYDERRVIGGSDFYCKSRDSGLIPKAVTKKASG